MASPFAWLEALAGLKALFDVAEGARDYWERYRAHLDEGDTIRESRRVADAFSTYSDAEVRVLVKKIEGCRDRFVNEGSGKDRASCICGILNEIRDGNGGKLPLIDDWERIYSQLQCEKRRGQRN